MKASYFLPFFFKEKHHLGWNETSQKKWKNLWCCLLVKSFSRWISTL